MNSSFFLLLVRRSLAAQFVAHLLAGVVALLLVTGFAHTKAQPVTSPAMLQATAAAATSPYVTIGTLASR